MNRDIVDVMTECKAWLLALDSQIGHNPAIKARVDALQDELTTHITIINQTRLEWLARRTPFNDKPI